MRKTHIFVGSSHPELGQLICDRLGVDAAPCTLRKFANGETSIEIGVSVRDEDVYVVQSSSGSVNDHLMELLILISGCRGGSANKITAVIPLFPYSKQSKMKKHRGAITAKMLANLLIMAGADHVITMDLHASQMQGFFTKPVDNLVAIPTLARWIRHHVPNYEDAVIVSKNPGGTKRVTALADALKVNFAMIHTDRRRTKDDPMSRILSNRNLSRLNSPSVTNLNSPAGYFASRNNNNNHNTTAGTATTDGSPSKRQPSHSNSHLSKYAANSKNQEPSDKRSLAESTSSSTANSNPLSTVEEEVSDTGDDTASIASSGFSHGIQIARVIDGHVVDDDYISPEVSESEGELSNVEGEGHSGNLTDSVFSIQDTHHALGGTVDANGSDDEEEIPTHQERLIALVGNVRDRTAILLDDMIDRPNSFIAAAEHCVKNCGASCVYVIATHGIFSDSSLEKLTACQYIDHIVVTNTYPIKGKSSKLTVIDISSIFAECIRRNHNGESISALFEQLMLL